MLTLLLALAIGYAIGALTAYLFPRSGTIWPCGTSTFIPPHTYTTTARQDDVYRPCRCGTREYPRFDRACPLHGARVTAAYDDRQTQAIRRACVSCLTIYDFTDRTETLCATCRREIGVPQMKKESR